MTILHLLHDFPIRNEIPLSRDDPAYRLRAKQRAMILALTGEEAPVELSDKENWIEAVVRASVLIDEATIAKAALWGIKETNKPVKSIADFMPMNAIAAAAGADASTVFYDLCTHHPISLIQRITSRSGMPITREIAPRHVPYGFNAGFRSLARRRFILCNLNADEPDHNHPDQPSLKSQLGAFAGQESVWKHLTGHLKAVPVKILDFTEKTAEQCRLSKEFGWDTMNLTGTCALQDHVEMKREYRVFIIDGRPVAGAGCIERNTPLNAQMGAFSSEMEETRNLNQIPELSAFNANRYRVFSGRAANEIRAADPAFPKTYVIDLFETSDDEIGIVELTPLLASGLFATNYRYIAKALIKACEHDAAVQTSVIAGVSKSHVEQPVEEEWSDL